MTSIIRYKLVIFFALIFSIVIVSPRVIAIFSIPSTNFNSIYPYFVEDELHYGARINAVVNSGIFTGNPYLSEHANDMAVQSYLPESIVALIAILLGSSLGFAMLLSIFIFIFVDYILVYAVIFQNTRNKYLSLFFASVFFILFIQTFGRPISPQLNISFLLMAIFSLNLLVYGNESKNQKIIHSVLGTLSGILLFVTPYYWTAILVLYSLVIFSRIVSERNFEILNRVIFNFLPFFLVFLTPFIYTSVVSSGLPGYAEGSSRFGVIKTHFPGAWSNILLVLLTSVSLYVSRKYIKKESLVYGLILLFSAVVLNWHNIITGIYFQFSSHYLVVTVLFVTVVLSIIVSSVLNSDLGKYKKFLLLIPVALILSVMFYTQKYEIKLLLNQKITSESFRELQEYSNIFSWLNVNTPRDSVVYSLGGEYANLLPVYTHNKVYTNLYITIFPITDKEVRDRWLINNIFNLNINKEFVLRSEKELWMNRYVDSYFYNKNKYRMFSLLGTGVEINEPRIPEEEIQGVLSEYLKMRKLKLEEIFNMYNMDYIILDPKYSFYKETKSILDNLAFVNKVASFDGKVIYKVGKIGKNIQ